MQVRKRTPDGWEPLSIFGVIEGVIDVPKIDQDISIVIDKDRGVHQPR
jgi:hypothetical protein